MLARSCFLPITVYIVTTFLVRSSYSDCRTVTEHTNWNLLPQPGVCGTSTAGKQDDVTARIYGGQEAMLGEFPWAVIIVTNYGPPFWKFWRDRFNNECIGSIINERYVVTAAHCFLVEDDPIKGVTAYVGDWDKSTDPDKQGSLQAPPRREVKIEKIVFHPQADYASLMFDIALVRLEEKLVFNDFVKPICLPTNCTYQYENMFLKLNLKGIGWGLSTPDGSSNRLKKLVSQIVQQSQCDIWWGQEVAASAGNEKDVGMAISPPPVSGVDPLAAKLCVRARANRTTCKGDSGGPLMLSSVQPGVEEKVQILVGVLSFGDWCFMDFGLAERPYPSVYTSVLEVMGWLMDNIRE